MARQPGVQHDALHKTLQGARKTREARFQVKGAPRQPYEQLGWQTAIRTHRPLLPYPELGAVFDKPSEIHDALSASAPLQAARTRSAHGSSGCL